MVHASASSAWRASSASSQHSPDHWTAARTAPWASTRQRKAKQNASLALKPVLCTKICPVKKIAKRATSAPWAPSAKTAACLSRAAAWTVMLGNFNHAMIYLLLNAQSARQANFRTGPVSPRARNAPTASFNSKTARSIAACVSSGVSVEATLWGADDVEPQVATAARRSTSGLQASSAYSVRWGALKPRRRRRAAAPVTLVCILPAWVSHCARDAPPGSFRQVKRGPRATLARLANTRSNLHERHV